MKIIFLDIDGVLNSRAYDRSRDWNILSDIDETRLPLLKRLVDESGAKIVLSSTWRVHWNKDRNLCNEDGRYIIDTLGKYGISIYDRTPIHSAYMLRKQEISEWLDANKDDVETFVIIDDDQFGWDELSPYFVKTNPNFGRGLEQAHIIQALEILNRNR